MTRLLVVAGHDPSYRRGWGAGVDADREAAERFGVSAACVISAWTEQDGTRVRSVRARAAPEWLAEARAFAREPVHALKSGLLPDADAVRALCALVRELGPRLPVVVDPVLAASGGEPFLDSAGLSALVEELLPLGVILTPNLPEAASLTGHELAALQLDRAARLAAAHELLERGCRALVLKGGHAHDEPAADLLLERGSAPLWLTHPRLPGANLHGSGCRYASALASALALGHPLSTAAAQASAWLAELLQARPA